MARISQLSSLRPRDWVKGKAIGSGSFGTVHLAMTKATGGLFVVKAAQTEEALVSLKNEADILESLNSRHVVRCLGRDVVRDSNSKERTVIFMEYVAGGSLWEVVEKFGGSLDEEVVRVYTREILHGLDYLHRNGIVHCDLKCKNVLLDSDGNVKLCDLGCAKRLEGPIISHVLTHSSRSVGGTPLWMAPEVLRNEGLEAKSDIWSLGCTLIEMATGRPPWASDISTPEAALMKIANSNEMPQFPKQFSEEGLDFLRKCFQRDPKRRWTATELLDHPFISLNSMRKEVADSPASVLMFGFHDEDSNSDSDEVGFSYANELFKKNQFYGKCHLEERTVNNQPENSEFRSSGNWITVR
ncbi:mitogen-activated protein kinase kinase kinase 17-like [Punica granatum]|uniref:Mitogen-activated protein kinase kinase kinase 17-like n=1 Tax=Punica granatum TaxID=22663 RepID=A0A218X485_PUNGR|nr:mitogen-activated protein kinase kinase kinase 17-like [Punica granatum]OWM79311.1 hypothetical protein CDL15_Pgr003484 [Punica granatum]